MLTLFFGRRRTDPLSWVTERHDWILMALVRYDSERANPQTVGDMGISAAAADDGPFACMSC